MNKRMATSYANMQFFVTADIENLTNVCASYHKRFNRMLSSLITTGKAGIVLSGDKGMPNYEYYRTLEFRLIASELEYLVSTLIGSSVQVSYHTHGSKSRIVFKLTARKDN